MNSFAPDFDALLNMIWGWPDEYDSAILANASNVIIGTNPPYDISDFLTWYPNFAGPPITTHGDVDGVTDIITGVASIIGIVQGNPIAANGVPKGSMVVSVAGTEIVISQITTEAFSNTTLTIWNSFPIVPVQVINAYINLAGVSIQYQRWFEMWPMMMALFVAHYITMWLQSQGTNPNPTAAQLATSGLATGIKVSKAAGDVSVGIKSLDGFENWGTFQLTSYGMQLATLAQGVGPFLAW